MSTTTTKTHAAGMAALAKNIGARAMARVSPSGSGPFWFVPVTIRDVRSAFGRVDYLVEPTSTAEGDPTWLESGRMRQIGGVE